MNKVTRYNLDPVQKKNSKKNLTNFHLQFGDVFQHHIWTSVKEFIEIGDYTLSSPLFQFIFKFDTKIIEQIKTEEMT